MPSGAIRPHTGFGLVPWGGGNPRPKNLGLDKSARASKIGDQVDLRRDRLHMGKLRLRKASSLACRFT